MRAAFRPKAPAVDRGSGETRSPAIVSAIFGLRILAALVLLLVPIACTPPDGGDDGDDGDERSPAMSAPQPNPLMLSAEPGASASGSIRFTNTGDADLTFEIAVAEAAEAWLGVRPTAGSLEPGERQVLAVTGACGATEAEHSGSLEIDSDAARDPSRSLAVELSCVAEEPPPPTSDLECSDVTPLSETPTLQCTSEEAGVTLSIPWQGRRVAVEELSKDDLGELPESEEFRPLSARPLIHLAVVEESDGNRVTSFDPPLELSVRYGYDEFVAADPGVDSGELGLGMWNDAAGSLLVAGHGVFESGFWVADPRVGQPDLTLLGNPDRRLPRFKMTGGGDGGEAIALIGETPATLAPVWGAMPFDMDHMMVGFGECEEFEDPETGLAVVECASTDGAVTVRVPYQRDGSLRPRLIALPWNKDETLRTPSDQGETVTAQQQSGHERSLMNFLVVDHYSPETVLTSFDPPMEFEVAYTGDDISLDPDNPEFLALNFWDEELESLVILGAGDTSECFDENGELKVGWPWGQTWAAAATDDPTYEKDGVVHFFLMEDTEGNGRAKFFFDRWGDRMVAFGR